MSSAYFTDEQLKKPLTAPKKAAPAPKAVTTKAAPAAAPAPGIADPALAAEVEAFRAFERDEIEPLARAVPVVFRPKSTAGLVCVAAVGCYVAASDVAKFRANMRDVAYRRGMFRRDHLAACFTAALVDNALDEAAALVASCLNYHDDRGDGMLWVPAFKRREAREAWARACAALGIASRARACQR